MPHMYTIVEVLDNSRIYMWSSWGDQSTVFPQLECVLDYNASLITTPLKSHFNTNQARPHFERATSAIT